MTHPCGLGNCKFWPRNKSLENRQCCQTWALICLNLDKLLILHLPFNSLTLHLLCHQYLQQPKRAGQLPGRADINTSSQKNVLNNKKHAKCFQERWKKPKQQWRPRPSGCVGGRRTLTVLTFRCRSNQSVCPCGRSSSPKQPRLYPWYLPNRRHYINLTADTGYVSTRHRVELPGWLGSTFQPLTSNHSSAYN